MSGRTQSCGTPAPNGGGWRHAHSALTGLYWPLQRAAGGRNRHRFGVRWAAAFATCASATASILAAGTVACWRFDEPTSITAGGWLKDEVPLGLDLRMGRGGEIVGGRFGHALQSIAGEPRQSARDRATTAFRAVGDASEKALFNPIATALNLGAHDWTLECWLKLDAIGDGEGTLFEIGAGPAGSNEVLTRVSVLPRENAFLLAGLSRVSPDEAGVGQRSVRYPRADGPPDEVALLQVTTLALRESALPRQRWFHVALVHHAARDAVRLFIDGEPRAVAALQHRAVPEGNHGYVSVGRDGRGLRALPGAIDELRISDSADYQAAFSPDRPRLRRVGRGATPGPDPAQAFAAAGAP